MADIVVTTAPPLNVTVQTDSTSISVNQPGAPQITVESGFSAQNVFVRKVQPTFAAPGMWIQTFDNGDWTLWIEDGK